MEQTLEPESTLLSVFPHEVCSERYPTHIVGILHSGSLCFLGCNYWKHFSCVILVCCLWTRYSTAVFLSSLRQIFYHFLKGIISYTYGSFWTFTRCILELAASENLFQYFCLIYYTCLIHRQISSGASQDISEKLEEQESRQAELNHYVKMVLS